MSTTNDRAGGRFRARTVLVTGGSGGIGRAICERFAARGARLAVHYNGSHGRAEEVLDRLDGDGHLCVQADLADATALERMFEAVIDRFGRLDVLVNNAGVYERQPPLEVDHASWRASWQRTLALNLVAAADLCHLAARQMQLQGGGRIINISSRGAFRGEPEAPAYGASKAGLNALSQSLAVALAPHGIQVYAVAPGFVETAMARPYLTGEMADAIRRQSPLGRVARVEDVAYWVTCLAAAEAEFATGTIIDVNGASYLRS